MRSSSKETSAPQDGHFIALSATSVPPTQDYDQESLNINCLKNHFKYQADYIAFLL